MVAAQSKSLYNLFYFHSLGFQRLGQSAVDPGADVDVDVFDVDGRRRHQFRLLPASEGWFSSAGAVDATSAVAAGFHDRLGHRHHLHHVRRRGREGWNLRPGFVRSQRQNARSVSRLRCLYASVYLCAFACVRACVRAYVCMCLNINT